MSTKTRTTGAPAQPHDDRVNGLRALKRTAKLTALSLSTFSVAERTSDQTLAETEVRKLFRDDEQNRGLAATLYKLLEDWGPFIPPRERVILQTIDIEETTGCAALCKVWEEFGASILLAIHEGSGLKRSLRDMSTSELVGEMKTYWPLVQEHTKWLRNIDWREFSHEIDGEITDGVEQILKKHDWSKPIASSPDPPKADAGGVGDKGAAASEAVPGCPDLMWRNKTEVSRYTGVPVRTISNWLEPDGKLMFHDDRDNRYLISTAHLDMLKQEREQKVKELRKKKDGKKRKKKPA